MFDFGLVFWCFFAVIFLWQGLFGVLFVNCHCCCEFSNYTGLDWEPLPPRGAENNAQIRAVLTITPYFIKQMNGSSVEESADF